ncbi:hypothetical protein [Paenibacillus sp. MMS18-CY102]|uniref:hypothetical protein n=1 Tax=Paenibacillus sp. MMS18-CY102 TaxID=2682849 RepID=UPI001365E227|nr:hypothetical protein [Paenibacillus sp. MMS18-CY102]MWC29756.1 hypothetical protein [Paenibacillus sp. MMS18-CY102]
MNSNGIVAASATLGGASPIAERAMRDADAALKVTSHCKTCNGNGAKDLILSQKHAVHQLALYSMQWDGVRRLRAGEVIA